MGTEKLKLRKEVLSNLTNLNMREMEELKGGKEAQGIVYSISIFTITVTKSSTTYTVTITLSVTVPS